MPNDENAARADSDKQDAVIIDAQLLSPDLWGLAVHARRQTAGTVVHDKHSALLQPDPLSAKGDAVFPYLLHALAVQFREISLLLNLPQGRLGRAL